MHRVSLALGAAAVGGPIGIMIIMHDANISAAPLAFFIAGAAGRGRIDTWRFFAGAMLAFSCLILLSAIFEPAPDLPSAIIMVPVLFFLVIVLGGAAFLAGRVTNRIHGCWAARRNAA